ncbi:hypothetical protein ACP4OV_018175 [Aristida adscensionis]
MTRWSIIRWFTNTAKQPEPTRSSSAPNARARTPHPAASRVFAYFTGVPRRFTASHTARARPPPALVWLRLLGSPAHDPTSPPRLLASPSMADYNRYGHAYAGYAQAPPPSAPPAPTPAASAPPASYSSPPPASYGSYGQGGAYPSSYPPPAASQSQPGGYGFGFGFGGGAVAFPPGTRPEVERAFRAADRDGSGAIDERELQGALSAAYHRFSIRTVRLLMFLFADPASSYAAAASSPSRMGPAQFVSLWDCLGQWRGIFDRYDRDRSGKIDSHELTEALRSLGYAVPPSVIELLIANYNNGVPRNGALDFDNFVECGMIVKGLTEKFKEKDTRYTGSATLTYDGFLSMVIPFIVP